MAFEYYQVLLVTKDGQALGCMEGTDRRQLLLDIREVANRLLDGLSREEETMSRSSVDVTCRSKRGGFGGAGFPEPRHAVSAARVRSSQREVPIALRSC